MEDFTDRLGRTYLAHESGLVVPLRELGDDGRVKTISEEYGVALPEIGRWVNTGHFSPWVSTYNNILTAGRDYFFWMYTPVSFMISKVAVRCSANAAGTIALAHYTHDTSTNKPGVRDSSIAVITIDGTGAKQADLSTRIPSGYSWWGANASATPTITGDSTSLIPFGDAVAFDSTLNSKQAKFYKARAYDGTTPDAFPSGTTEGFDSIRIAMEVA